MKLEFGCGTKLTPGFIGVDIRPLPTVTYVSNAWELHEQVEQESVEVIKSRHFLEHLTFFDVNRTLQSWYGILKRDGLLMIEVPNMTFHAEQWLSENRKTRIRTEIGQHKWTDEEWAIAGFWGAQRETEQGEIWDIHKSGYDFKLLEEYLHKYNFRNVVDKSTMPQNLYVECIK